MWKKTALIMSLIVIAAFFYSDQFPVDKQGYPIRDIIIVNKVNYRLDLNKNQKEIDIKIRPGKLIKLALPQQLPIYTWSIDQTNANLISYSKEQIKHHKILEGPSDCIQKFEFTAPIGTQVELKLCNINQEEKPFKEKKAEYTVKLNILDKRL